MEDFIAKQVLTSVAVEKEIYARLTGSGYPAISASDLAEITIQVPPLSEQRRIANILATWNRAIDKSGAHLSSAERLFGSMIARFA